MIRKSFVAAAVLAAFAGPAQAQETTILFNSFIQPKNVFNTDVVNPWLAGITKATEGRVKFEVPPTSLAAPQQQYDGVNKGVMDAAYMMHGFLADRVKLSQVAHLPLNSTTPRGNSVALWRTYEKFFAKSDEYKDVQVLSLFAGPPGQIFAMKEAPQSLKDLKGVKWYALPGTTARLFEMAGAAVVAQPAVRSHEVISGGTVDGFAGYAVMDAAAFHTLQYAKTVVEVPGFLPPPSFVMFVNKKKWASIPQRDRDIIVKMSGEEFGKRMAVYDPLVLAAKADAQAKGIKFVQAGAAFVAALESLAAPLEQGWLADAQKLGVDGKAALAFYRAESQKNTK